MDGGSWAACFRPSEPAQPRAWFLPREAWPPGPALLRAWPGLPPPRPLQPREPRPAGPPPELHGSFWVGFGVVRGQAPPSSLDGS